MDLDCPTCGKEYGSESWVQRHHNEEHGSYIPNQTCIVCGKEFYSPARDYKSCDDCNPQAGENNPNYTGAKEEGECVVCGDTFEYYPSDKYGKYCSKHSNERWRPISMNLDYFGYETFRTDYGGEISRFKHHRLLAVAKFGFDALKDNIVHHKNNCSWDNRIENLEVMERGEHSKLHWEQGDVKADHLEPN